MIAETEYDWVDLSSVGTPLGFTSVNDYAVITLPWAFPYYGGSSLDIAGPSRSWTRSSRAPEICSMGTGSSPSASTTPS